MDLELFSQIMPMRFYRTRAMAGTRYPNRKYSYARYVFGVSSEILFRLSRHIIAPVAVSRALSRPIAMFVDESDDASIAASIDAGI